MTIRNGTEPVPPATKPGMTNALRNRRRSMATIRRTTGNTGPQKRIVTLFVALTLGLTVMAVSTPAAATPTTGTVVGWGDNSFGGAASPPAGLTGVTAISAGGYHSLALKSDGTVVGWGENNSGEASPPAGLTGVTAISAGRLHSLALHGDGTVVGWGYNDFGQASPPAGLTGVTAISASDFHSLALKSDGTVVGWGDNGYGQASPPAGLTGVIEISAGGLHSLALKSDGTVVGWGNNVNGEASPPAGLTGVTAISAGSAHSLALKSDGTVVGWGFNDFGQASPPVGLTGVIEISAGGFHSLALTTVVADTTPPVVTVPTDVTAPATSVSGAVVTYPPATAQDNVAGTLPVTCTPASGAMFALGQSTVTCTATDPSGNTGSASFHVSVTYAWSGVPRPFSADGTSTFKGGSTIPVKVALTGASAPITNATITLSYARVLNGVVGSYMDASTNVKASAGSSFRYSGNQYIFNWSTKGLAPGRYSVKVNLGDGVPHAVPITLK